MPETKRWEDMKTEEKPLITVVTLTYCRFENIYNCISSVLNQDYPNIEYIISDDGSPNFEKEKIESFISKSKKSNLKELQVLTHEHNVGTVKNINGAYRAAQGQYIINVSGDDAFASNDVISRIVEKINIGRPDVMGISRVAATEDGQEMYYMPHAAYVKKVSSFDRKKQFEKYVSGQFYAMFSGSALVYRKQFVEEMGYFDEQYTLWEDGPFIAKTLETTRIFPAYDIIGIRYSTGGVSGGTTNTLLLRDVERYNRTTRRENAHKLGLFYRALTLFNIRDCGLDYCERLTYAAMIVPIAVYKLFYKMSYVILEKMEIADLREVKRH